MKMSMANASDELHLSLTWSLFLIFQSSCSGSHSIHLHVDTLTKSIECNVEAIWIRPD